MRIDVVTIFPEYLAPLELALLGRARSGGLVDLRTHDLRRWAHDRHRTVDDTPYGGGPGMVMSPEPWGEALDLLVDSSPPQPSARPRLLVTSPSGARFTQAVADRLSAEPWLIFACGRYEGIDARVVEHYSAALPVEELSVGDVVLNGGEVAAMAMIEAIVRLLPGFVGNPASLVEESHAAEAGGLLEPPAYTKPPSWRGHAVPGVLLSGHHERIAAWRRAQAEQRTRERRPDLLSPIVWEESSASGGGSSEAGDRLLLRAAVPADAGEVLTLQRACWVTEAQANGDAGIPPLVETLADVRQGLTEHTTWVLRAGHRLVGAVRARLEQDTWQIGRLMVAPDLQGRGLGGRLLAHAEAQAPGGTRRYAIFTGVGSRANLAWYRRAGYRPARGLGGPAQTAGTGDGGSAGRAEVVWLVKPRPEAPYDAGSG